MCCVVWASAATFIELAVYIHIVKVNRIFIKVFCVFHIASVLKEPFAEKEARIRANSPYGHLPNWNILFKIFQTR